MENIKKYIYSIIIVLLLLTIFTQRSCSEDKKIVYQKVIIPAKSGNFKTTKPKEITSPKIKYVIQYKDRKVVTSAKVDTILAKEYLKANDSIEKLNLYLNSIKVRKYSQNFNNDDLDLTIDAEATGTLNYLKPKYTLKQREISVPIKQKETSIAVYTGLELKTSLDASKTSLKGDLGIQNKKGDIYSVGYDTNKNVYIGYKIRLINIKK